jgi:methyltransferase (TIGR00027 family)
MATNAPPQSSQLGLEDVSITGLLTAYCHAIESRRPAPILRDPQAEAIADRLAPALAASPSRILRDLAAGSVRDALVVHLALRARQYDEYARDFAQRHPGATVVNLGCGLDTRFWRIDDGRLHLIDLDLPHVIALKRDLVPQADRYHMVGMSVLEEEWMDRLAAESDGPFIFLAEGLFMYLPKGTPRVLVTELQSRFPGSELVFETVNSRWLRPGLKWMIDVKLHKELGLGPGTEFRSGIRDGHEVEEWSRGIRLLEEWTYFDVDEPRIGAIRVFRHWRPLRYTQWTVRYLLGPKGPLPE